MGTNFSKYSKSAASEITWEPVTIVIEQRGRSAWDWQVWYDNRKQKYGTQLTKSGAVRKAKRYRKGRINV